MAAKDLVGPAFVGSDTSSFIVTRGITAPGKPFQSRFSPGGCDKCCCVVAVDAFNRADSTDVNVGTGYGNWEEVAGDWAIVSNAVRVVATPNAILKSKVRKSATRGGRDRFYVHVRAKPSASGDKVRVIASYLDANNFVFGEITCPAGPIVIGARVAGVETIYQSNTWQVSFGAGIYHDFAMCVDQANGYMSFGLETATQVRAEVTLAGNGYFALGTGNVCTGNVDFDSLLVLRVEANHLGAVSPGYSSTPATNAAAGGGYRVDFGGNSTSTTTIFGNNINCKQCSANCDGCLHHTYPASYQVTISGMVTQDVPAGVCPNCATFNGTYILPLLANGTGTPLHGDCLTINGDIPSQCLQRILVPQCHYSLALSPETCRVNRIRLQLISPQSLSPWQVTIDHSAPYGVVSTSLSWRAKALPGPAPVDCRFQNSVSDPALNSGSSSWCSHGSSTATVTAL